MSLLEDRAIVIKSNCQKYVKQSESRLSDNNTLDNYLGDYLKLIVEDSSIENTCWVKGPHEYEQNLINARQDLESFINKMLSCFENKEIYTSLFNGFINNCLEMITTDWDNFQEYEKHIVYVKDFIKTFKATKNNIDEYIITNGYLPFGNKLPLDIQNSILLIKNDIIYENYINDFYIT